MSLLPSPVINTVEQYLDLERSSEQRHEYLDGQIYAMAGKSQEPRTICTNLGGQLYNQLRGKPCQVFSKDMTVRSGPTPTLRHAAKGLIFLP
jgi:Uma2 family endonuclease